jgi:GTP cyclohydrolase I
MELETSIKAILEVIDPNSEQIVETPRRVARSYAEYFDGYGKDASTIATAFYNSDMNDLVILKNIPFDSHCEHHMCPIVGTASVGYIPNGRIIGASKLARIVDCFAHRLQLQERMTVEIGKALEAVLQAVGVGVYIEADHFCISHRGVRKLGAKFVTRYFSGVLKEKMLRSEFLATVIPK